MKRLVSALLALLIFSLLTAPAALCEAANEPILADDAGLFTEDQEALLTEGMRTVSAFGVPMLWTTRESGSTARLAEAYYHDRIGTESGVLFVINMNERMIYLFSDGEMYRTVTPSRARTITDNVYSGASRGDYYACATEAFSQIRDLMNGNRIAEPMRIITCVILALTLATVIIYLLAGAIHTQRTALRKGEFIGVLPRSLTPSQREYRVIPKLLAETTVSVSIVRHDSDSGGGGGGGGGRSGGGGGGGGGGHSGGGGGHRF
ncbi:MAG: TPM domain-containing protein [Clostridia bacterium]|nr:TPM domain-containing protein [Clostridia bacterium]